MIDTPLFATPAILLQGALAGLLFGFLLHKGGLTRFDVIVKQFLLRDFTVLKVMLTAIAVGGVGLYVSSDAGWLAGWHIKSTHLLANALGGAIFGVGMAVLGYCPGTGIAAMGSGSRHAVFGVLGMLLGAAIYAEAYPWVKEHILGVGAWGKETLPSLTGWSPWVFLAALSVAAVTFSLRRSHATRKGLHRQELLRT